MKKGNLVVQSGVMALLANIHRPLPYGVFTFKGDVCQMADAADVARSLGFVVGVGEGVPYVEKKEEYDEVISYLRDHRVSGFWHYE